ncbi:TPA: hypothetical protein JI054_01080 [Acinetobacter baumannii]|uniref:hypothetical protein n=1 Tax=Acinetobacter baumannii TaxID=470 RepID=UPI00054C2D42|nr:hypothetical protein [Acinetobacter baumannii]CAH1069465.1 Uncharacterised protein [Acinetobacter phage MD-2021a]EKV3813100.1 hypothetical protein [Acinetobacter baumannii]EKW1221076.1 hypothetical protein [Acinetobacter baumannii]EKW2152340.1 hypothetical protein [Acinetobacter baumannii]ELB0339121.1 hypothetical protein [Acinetobacter baumannii]
MRDDQIERIKVMSEDIAEDMLKTAYVALETPLDSKQARGDKGFMYKIVKDQAGVIATIQRILDIKSGKIPPISATQATQEKYEQQLIEKAEKEAEKLKQRLS